MVFWLEKIRTPSSVESTALTVDALCWQLISQREANRPTVVTVHSQTLVHISQIKTAQTSQLQYIFWTMQQWTESCWSLFFFISPGPEQKGSVTSVSWQPELKCFHRWKTNRHTKRKFGVSVGLCDPLCLHHAGSLCQCMCVWTATWSGFFCVKWDCDTWATGPRSWMSWCTPQFEWWGINPFWFSRRGCVCGCMCESEVGDEVRADLESKPRRWQGSAWLWELGRGGGGKTKSGEWNKKRSSKDGGRGHVFILLKSKAGSGVQREWATTKQRAGGLMLCRTKSALKDKGRSDSWGRGQTGAEGRGRER